MTEGGSLTYTKNTVTRAGTLSSSPSLATTCSCLCNPLGSSALFSYWTDWSRRSYSEIVARPLRRRVAASLSNMDETTLDVVVSVSISSNPLPGVSI